MGVGGLGGGGHGGGGAAFGGEVNAATQNSCGPQVAFRWGACRAVCPLESLQWEWEFQLLNYRYLCVVTVTEFAKDAFIPHGSKQVKY